MSLSTVPPPTRFLKVFKEPGRTLIALSGGGDSATLLALAAQAIGRQNVLAVTTFSAAVPEAERRAAGRVAAFVGVDHHEAETRELENPEYRGNTGDRCFHCRMEMSETLRGIARERGYDTVAYGAIVDDLGDDRPGMLAAERLGIRAPLLEAGFTKQEVRGIARELGLPVSAKPAAACLASRLELDPEGLRRLADVTLRRRLVADVRAVGFRFVTVDLEGYRSGSLNVTSAGGFVGRADPGSPRRSD